MRFFRTELRTVVRPPQPSVPTETKPPIIEGWSETELVSVYNAAPVKHLKKGEQILIDAPSSNSFFVLIDGMLQVVVKLNGQPGRPGFFKRGDCIAPLPASPGLAYCAE